MKQQRAPRSSKVGSHHESHRCPIFRSWRPHFPLTEIQSMPCSTIWCYSSKRIVSVGSKENEASSFTRSNTDTSYVLRGRADNNMATVSARKAGLFDDKRHPWPISTSCRLQCLHRSGRKWLHLWPLSFSHSLFSHVYRPSGTR
jgi:hypothetical protein